MKMKIAFLCPLRRRVATGSEDTLENKISLLAGELVRQGVDLTLLAAEGSQSPAGLVAIAPRPLEEEPESQGADHEAMALCEAFSHAGRFDIIHNFLGAPALPYTALIKTPMVSMWAEPGPAHTAIYRRFSKTARFISEGASPGEYTAKSSSMDQSDFFAKITVIRKGPPEITAREYLAVYMEILSKRENFRPWGHYENLAEGPDHKIKRIIVSPGGRLSLQKHQRRAERWIVISGEAVVTLDSAQIPLKPGDTVFIPKEAAHRVHNPGGAPLIFAEVQLGEYFGEDDIIRLQDDYGRGA